MTTNTNQNQVKEPTITIALKQERPNTDRLSYAPFGGVASAMAACFTHPLDLIKVHKQLLTVDKGTLGYGAQLVKSQGPIGLYSGLTASLGRQMTYSLSRFAAYDYLKYKVTENKRPFTVMEKFSVAFSAGIIGGILGTPCDCINVRMQIDSAYAKNNPLRRNYNHVFNGLGRVYAEEGVKSIFKGWEFATIRAGLMTIGQIAMYDIFKETAMKRNLPDNIATHFVCASAAGICGVLYTMPLDVLKSKYMGAKPGTYKGLGDCFAVTLKQGGPLAFTKGFIPAAVRIMPHTILTWVFKEQLRLNFGYFPEEK